jgi:hypothetical protein
LTTSAGWSWGTRFYWENLATSWRRKPIVISAIPRRPHQRTNHECQIGRPEALMRCAKNLINSITPPINDKINPQIFSVFGVNTHIGTTSNTLCEILNGNWHATRVKIHGSLKLPLCSCLWITLPAWIGGQDRRPNGSASEMRSKPR